MGNLVTRGKAEGNFDAERMVVTVIIQKEGTDTNYVLSCVQQQCESFLEELKEIKITPEKIRVIDGGLHKNYNNEYSKAERKIVIDMQIDVLLCTYLCSLIKKYGDNIQYYVSYDVDRKEELSNRLLELAVEDSRRQAKKIAEALGKTITGVISVNDHRYVSNEFKKSIVVGEALEIEFPEAFISETPLTDQTAFPTVSLDEEIEICWNMSE